MNHVARRPLLAVLAFAVVLSTTARAADPEIVSVRKVWDAAPHNAFTDLIRFRDAWFLTFRESEGHVGGNGKLRVLTSADGERWESAALLAEEGIDLRDPKLSVTPDGRLMIVAGGSVYDGKTFKGRQPRVAFSQDGHTWTPTTRVLAEGDWLWRVTWHGGRAYGCSYDYRDSDREADRSLKLYASDDGVTYELVTTLRVPNLANETTVRVLPDGEMLALVRRESGNRRGWIGSSRPPYTDWTWNETEHRLGGPNFIALPDGSLLAGTRGSGPTTVLARMDRTSLTPILTLPSDGDTSYPGLVMHDGLLWVSYYSSHEGKSAIYLAKVRLN